MPNAALLPAIASSSSYQNAAPNSMTGVALDISIGQEHCLLEIKERVAIRKLDAGKQVNYPRPYHLHERDAIRDGAGHIFS
ncbi:hypothetical protein VTK26DRAFT_5738 [Humicola hyalothermophila]